jgi:hypothetical protein
MKSRSVSSAWHIGHTGKVRNAFEVLITKPEEKGLFGRPG